DEPGSVQRVRHGTALKGDRNSCGRRVWDLTTQLRERRAERAQDCRRGKGRRRHNDRARVDAGAVVMATPAFAAATILRALSPALAQLCGEIPYASAATVAVAFQRSAVSHPLNGSGFVVPKVENTGIMAASWLSSKWPNRAPEGRVLMRAFLGGARDPQAIERSDAELIQT